jgi:hypothetical protein
MPGLRDRLARNYDVVLSYHGNFIEIPNVSATSAEQAGTNAVESMIASIDVVEATEVRDW